MANSRAFAAGLALLLFTNMALAAEVQWQPQDMKAAMAKAQAEGKLIYIFVEGDNCPPCDAFKASHLADPAYVDFVNNMYVPIRVHAGKQADDEFLSNLRLTHAAVPRFYVLSPDGKGLSMSIGMVSAPPMGAGEVLRLADGRELPVNRERAAGLAARLRSHIASQRAAGTLYPDNPLRLLGVSILETEAWALAGRLDEAEKSFGKAWAGQLVDQEIRDWYVNFWLAWKHNLPGALEAAEAYRATNTDDPNGHWLVARALAANGRYRDAVKEGDALLAADPSNQRVAEQVEAWKKLAGGK